MHSQGVKRQDPHDLELMVDSLASTLSHAPRRWEIVNAKDEIQYCGDIGLEAEVSLL